MTISREQAWEKLREWTPSNALRIHARSVEIAMRAAARRHGASETEVERWGIAGLLHDADYEQWPETHPQKTVAWLEEQGEAEIAHAVSAHYTHWKQAYETLMDKALLACDELTGFIVACCLVRPDGIDSLNPKSVKKKLKDKSFAAKVDRDEIQAGITLLEIELGDHIQMLIDALRPHALELGLTGKGPA
ncbi:MAG: HD domain-containing protein [bacterium]|jgi:predicted hydrolase (HD superfamily)|nr:HD domain-containing protein [bacterium]